MSGPPIGLIAGWGRFPISVAETIRQGGGSVVGVAISGHADESLTSVCDNAITAGVGRFRRHIAFFRRHGVREVAMAGKLFKNEILYSGRSPLIRHRPDLTCLRTFAPLLWGRRRDARDDRLLTAVIDTYRRNGLTMAAATDLAPALLADAGTLTGGNVPTRLRGDIDFGWKAAKMMGGLDIGQAVTVRDGTVIAVEAIEGTDACIDRTGELCRSGGWTLVKVAKPNQDMRFDVPTIGVQTVQRVAAASGSAIVIEAGRTILLDREETIAAAKAAGRDVGRDVRALSNHFTARVRCIPTPQPPSGQSFALTVSPRGGEFPNFLPLGGRR